MKLHEAVIAWTPADLTEYPTAGSLMVGFLNEYRHDPRKPSQYRYVYSGSSYPFESLRGEALAAALLRKFNAIVIGDKCDPQVVHEALMSIDEYAEAIADRIPGARYRQA